MQYWIVYAVRSREYSFILSVKLSILNSDRRSVCGIMGLYVFAVEVFRRGVGGGEGRKKQ